jgi:hypothetical protein
LHHAVLYKAAPALKQWAWWVLNLVNNPDVAATPLQRALAKHFSRAFIGRFGAKFPLWEPFGAASTPGIDLAGFYDFDSGQMGKMLTVGGESFIGLEKEWVADANPAIMGAVLSACRQRLWQIFEAAGFENIVYCDTDSVIVNGDGHNNLSRWTSHGEGWGLRVKGQYNRLELLGPRQMIVEGRGRISGLPKRASRSSANEWVGERWDGVQTSLGSGQPDVVVVRDVVWRVNGIDRRRLHLAGGATAPVRVKPC